MLMKTSLIKERSLENKALIVARQGIAQRLISYFLDFIVVMRTSNIRKMIPKPIRSLGYQFLPKRSLEQKMWEAEHNRILKSSVPAPIRTSVRLGIIKDFMGKHAHYEAACRELGVPYELIDIIGNSWIEDMSNAECNAYLVWPSHFSSISKQIFDERLRVIVKEMKKTIFPLYDNLWLYESKRRMNDWLTVNNIPHPRTSVFFDKSEALGFLGSAEFPLVFKTDLGSTAYGVEVVRNKRSAKRLIDVCFGKGYLRKRCAWNDRSKDYILFQEYLTNVKEWRMVRIGDSFFGHQKLKKGEFHSGSKLVGWSEPPRRLLDFVREVSEKGPFLSVNIDIFKTEKGEYLVNELQAVFGSRNPEQMYINGKPGRFVYDGGSESWNFQEGNFCRNVCCNLRVKTLLNMLGKPLNG